MSREQDKKGSIAVGQLGDVAVLSDDYFSVPPEKIKDIQSVLTVVGGKIVYAAKPFEQMSPPTLPVMPDWSPVGKFGGYGAPGFYSMANQRTEDEAATSHASNCSCWVHDVHQAFASLTEPVRRRRRLRPTAQPWGVQGLFGSGCECFVF
jgi:hypothetical protein